LLFLIVYLEKKSIYALIDKKRKIKLAFSFIPPIYYGKFTFFVTRTYQHIGGMV